MPDEPIEFDPEEPSDSLAELASVLRSRRHAVRGAPADFGDRVGAKFFDLIIGAVFAGIPLAVAMLLVMGGMSDEVLFAPVIVGVACYFGMGWMNLTPEGTPGKRGALLRIMTPDGADAPLGRLIARWAVQAVTGYAWTVGPVAATLNVKPAGYSIDRIGLALFGLTMVVAVANIILLMTGPRRTIHDLVSGTVVGVARSVPEEPTAAFEVIPCAPLAASSSPPEGPTGTAAAPAGCPDSPARPVA